MHAKRFVGTLAAAAVAFSLIGCSGGSSDGGKQEEITVLSYSGIFQDNYQKAVIDKFEKANPNIKVKFAEGGSSAEMLGKLRSEKNSPKVDVAIMDLSVANSGNKEGLFEKLQEKSIPNLKNVVPLGRNKEGYGPAVTFDNLVVLYNKDKVKKKPTKIADLWNAPKNSVAIAAPPDIQGIALTILTEDNLGGNYQQGVEKAIGELQKLAPNVSTWQPQPDAYQLVTQGEASYAIGWNARGQFFSNESKQLGVVQPEDGLAFQINTINKVKGASKAADKFINYALSQKAQEDFTKEMYYAPVVKEVELNGDLKKRIASADNPKIVDIDWVWMADHRDAWTDEWRRKVIRG